MSPLTTREKNCYRHLHHSLLYYILNAYKESLCCWYSAKRVFFCLMNYVSDLAVFWRMKHKHSALGSSTQQSLVKFMAFGVSCESVEANSTSSFILALYLSISLKLSCCLSDSQVWRWECIQVWTAL